MTMKSTSFPAVTSPQGSAEGALTRRRPVLTLKRKRFADGGGGYGMTDLDVISVDPTGGFSGSPEIGAHRGDPANPNNASGLTAAQDSLHGERSIGGKLGDLALGSRSLSFDPVTGTFSAERDWGKTAIEKGLPLAFGPLGPLVGFGMRAGSAYGTPIDDDRVGRGPERGAGMADGGPVRLAGGGNPQVAALIQKAMASQGAPPGGPQAAPKPPPFRFIAKPDELARRYGGGDARSGVFTGADGGRADTIDAELEQDGFVVPADTVAARGDGNTRAGALQVARDLGVPSAARPIKTVKGGEVPAKVSSGEVYLDRNDTERAGGPGALSSYVEKTRKRYAQKLSRMKGPRR